MLVPIVEMRKQARSDLCLEMAKPGFELRLAGSKPVGSFCSAALAATSQGSGAGLCSCQQVVRQLFVEYTFKKTPNTEAIAAPKPNLWEKELHPLWG